MTEQFTSRATADASDPTRTSPSRKIAFCQISDITIKPYDSDYRNFYQTCYAHMPGYYFRDDFLDIPYWIPIISGGLDSSIEQEIIIVRDIDESINKIKKSSYDYVLFSAMNVNLFHIKKIIESCPSISFLVGGYVKDTEFSSYANCTYLDNPSELLKYPDLMYNIKSPPNYHLFNKTGRYIPRITLSTGCRYLCDFCSVPQVVVPKSRSDIFNQVTSLRELSFSLIYIDDKTFGQCDNYYLLREIYNYIKSFNEEFLGFIVQTTASQLTIKEGRYFREFVENLYVKYIEIGIEAYRDDLLGSLNKPHRVRHVLEVTNRVREWNERSQKSIHKDSLENSNVFLIPNLIFGIPGDDYKATGGYIKDYIDVLATFNYSNLSIYPGRRGKEYVQINEADADDYSFSKSWLTDEQADLGQSALREFMGRFYDKYNAR